MNIRMTFGCIGAVVVLSCVGLSGTVWAESAQDAVKQLERRALTPDIKAKSAESEKAAADAREAAKKRAERAKQEGRSLLDKAAKSRAE